MNNDNQEKNSMTIEDLNNFEPISFDLSEEDIKSIKGSRRLGCNYNPTPYGIKLDWDCFKIRIMAFPGDEEMLFPEI